jgi:hypothetical protein
MVILTNITLGTSTVNEITFYTENYDEDFTKILKIISVPGTTTTVNKTLAVDIARMEYRIDITGKIVYTDKTKFKNLVYNKGIVPMTFEGNIININFDKVKISNTGRDDNYLDIRFTAVISEDV